MGMSVEKAKDFKGTWGKLIRYCKSYMPAILIALVLAALGTVFQLIGPDKLKDMTNEIIKGLPALIKGQPVLGTIDLEAVTSIAMLLVFFYVSSGVLSFLENFIMATVTAKISKNMRTSVSQKINKLPLKYLDSMPYGDVLSRVTNDVDTVGQSLSNSITTLISNAVLLIGCIIMMFISNWIMAITAIISSLIGFVIMFVIMMKSQKYFIMQQKSLGDINAHIEENYTNHIRQNYLFCQN